MREDSAESVLLVGTDPNLKALVQEVVGPSVRLVVATSAREATREFSKRRRWRAIVLERYVPDGSCGFDLLSRFRDTGDLSVALVLSDSIDGAEANRAYDVLAVLLAPPPIRARLASFFLPFGPRIEAAGERWAKRYGLTESEKDILVRTGKNEPRVLIEQARRCTPGTLAKHVRNLLQKTGDESLKEAAARLVREAMGLG